MKLVYGFDQTSYGLAILAATKKGICALYLGDDQDVLREKLERNFSTHTLIHDSDAVSAHFQIVKKQLHNLDKKLAIPLDLFGSPFQKKVWDIVMDIPCGETLTYSDVAKILGSPLAVRAVGTACSANHISILVPCHRVIRKDGTLSGYRWGGERKRKLLAAERQIGTQAA